MPPRIQAFISYSHADISYLERLLIHLEPLKRQYDFLPWSDRKLKAGDLWREEIKRNIARSSLIVLMVSADFLASDFIIETEVPEALRKAADEGAKILPVIVSPCLFEESELGRYQAFNSPEETLQEYEDRGVEQEKVFVKVARRILSEMRERDSQVEAYQAAARQP